LRAVCLLPEPKRSSLLITELDKSIKLSNAMRHLPEDGLPSGLRGLFTHCRGRLKLGSAATRIGCERLHDKKQTLAHRSGLVCDFGWRFARGLRGRSLRRA